MTMIVPVWETLTHFGGGRPGKISEEIWDALWAEWQDRRNQVRRTLETLTVSHQVHIDNLEMALQIIARIGTLYNGLERKDQKELLRQVVIRVVANDAGNVSLELRTPFAYLRDLTDEIRTVKKQSKGGKAERETADLSLPFHPEHVRVSSNRAGRTGILSSRGIHVVWRGMKREYIRELVHRINLCWNWSLDAHFLR